TTDRASFIPTDASLGVAGRPQSATGQAIILSGRNVSKAVGEHYGPKPNPAVTAEVKRGTLFKEVIEAGGKAALITPYPQPFFDAISSGKRLLSSVPLAADSAGIPLMTADDLINGRAVSPGFTGQAWHDLLGYPDVPILTPHQAGQQIAHIAKNYHFSFFEHWPSDRFGHRGPLEDAVAHLELIDTALGGLFEAWDDENGLLIITSDHGNIEGKDSRHHTMNNVPTILIGHHHARLAEKVHDLSHIAPIVLEHLQFSRTYAP
ncbi:MAG: hypothetical protein AAF490_25655, partial [Chloroflexota bacterium]